MLGIKGRVEDLLESVDIKINGDQPWDIQIYDEKLFQRILKDGSVGLGEAYMDKWWDCKALDEFFNRILQAGLDQKIGATFPIAMDYVKSFFGNPQNKEHVYDVGEQHYDIGNDLYKAMLDERMVYTCGFWDGAENLEEAQENKLESVCQSLNLRPGHRVLDIGCGWGSFARYATEHYDVEVVGITISREQQKLATERSKELNVEIRLQDYRELNESFDRVVSLGMFEHVGSKNYRTYMQVVHRCLKKGGRFILHSIGSNKSVHSTDPWIEKYIFPNSMIPSVRQIGLAIEELFILEKWQNHGIDYEKTLMAWYKNFLDSWDQLKDQYNDRFFRMWKYYLLCSAGSFRARKNHQWEIILSKR